AAIALVGWLGLVPARAAGPAVEQNWPQWRGPLASGASATANPPVTWSETSNIRWKVKLPGSGTATPVIWGNQVFIQTAIPTGKKSDVANDAPGQIAAAPQGGGMPRAKQPAEPYQFVLLCLDRQTGKTLWQKVACERLPHEGHHPDHGFASYSPVTDGKHVFAYFGSRGLYCYDMQGNLKWQKDFGRMQTKMTFGEGSSPALADNAIIINWDHEGDDFIVALDTETGKELWRQKRDEQTSWATPLVVQHEGQTQIVTAATRRIIAYDLKSGKTIWECAGLTANVIPSPVAGDGMVFATSGFRGSALLAIRLGRTGDLTGTDAIAWSQKKGTPYVPSPLLYDGRLYFFSSNNGVLSCLDAKSGRPLIDGKRIDELDGVYASPVGASGRVYLVGRNGLTVVLKSSDTWEVLATNRLDEGFDASPAIVGTDLFLRGRGYLYCISESR
ncbi:MAG TPA: PQQ-binding-like beta-propeller repeat protein, partial [Tepidisphaeraceae bacterium]|nr:PQQ-binding-like beta-propeller repeat protein [Tepidisphaeraceae bacterium]